MIEAASATRLPASSSYPTWELCTCFIGGNDPPRSPCSNRHRSHRLQTENSERILALLSLRRANKKMELRHVAGPPRHPTSTHLLSNSWSRGCCCRLICPRP